MSSNKANRRAPTCPMCRVPIDESKIEKKMFKGIEAKGSAYNGPSKFGAIQEEDIMKDKKKDEIDDMFGASESDRSV